VAAFSRHKALFVSRFVKYRFSERLSCPDASLHVVHNFVDVAAIRHALSEDVPPSFEHPDRIRVLISGRVDPAKGVAASLEALHARGPSGAEVLVLGDGPDLPALQRLDWHGTVRFRGWAGHPEVVRAAAEADVVVVPSVSEESCSTAILEALTVGTDVIALRRGGNPELRAYEQRRGQLTLVDSMDELAAATLARRRADSAKSVGEAADVRARLAEILAVYGAGRGAGSPANARVSR
jgi:glycosyltransferase involved in cell wall biosynthesis